MEEITDSTLGWLYMLPPGEDTMWEKYWVTYKNCKLYFKRFKNSYSYTFALAVSDVLVRQITKNIMVPGETNLRKIECLILTHQFDTLCMFATLPLLYETQNLLKQHSAVISLLNQIESKIHQISMQTNPHADETNCRAWGKVAIKIGSITNFEYIGNIYVKVSLAPWKFKSKIV